MIEHFGDFYGVGQGLFTCADIRVNSQHLHYVYDCGGQTSKRLLRQSIKEALMEMRERRLNILFLSHLHLDHTSGLALLLKGLKKTGGVDNVILPYLYPAERAALAGYLSETAGYPPDPDGWYIEFLRAPAAYLRENGVRNVYFVRGGDGPETPPFENIVPHGPTEGPRQKEGDREDREDREGTIKVQVLADSNKDLVLQCQASELSVGGDDMDACASIMSSRSTIVTPWWFFLLFNKQISESKLEQFREDFEDLRQGQNLSDLLKDSSCCREVKVAYERIFGPKRLNDTSLAVLSACHTEHIQKPFSLQFGPYAPYCMPSRARLPILPFVTFEGMRHIMRNHTTCIGFVLLGDLPANREWPLIVRKFGLAEDNPQTWVLTYQVPHHGSRENWSKEQVRLLGRPTFVISAGAQNSYGHPDPEVLRDIALSNNPLVWVNEDLSFPHSLKIE